MFSDIPDTTSTTMIKLVWHTFMNNTSAHKRTC